MAQNGIARRMTMMIIDHLEAVQIGNHQKPAFFVAGGACHCLAGAAKEAAAIVKAGQFVGLDHLFKLADTVLLLIKAVLHVTCKIDKCRKRICAFGFNGGTGIDVRARLKFFSQLFQKFQMRVVHL